MLLELVKQNVKCDWLPCWHSPKGLIYIKPTNMHKDHWKILATINFINLSTALSIHRAKEIGMRKVLGGSRRSIVVQFLTETFLLTMAALLLALLAVRSPIPILSPCMAFTSWRAGTSWKGSTETA
jgi:hypothetical protein